MHTAGKTRREKKLSLALFGGLFAVVLWTASCAGHPVRNSKSPVPGPSDSISEQGKEPCSLDRLFHCPPGMDECVEIPLGICPDPNESSRRELTRISHCPPGTDSCYKIELKVRHLKHGPGQRRKCDIVRLMHCPPGMDVCVDIDLSAPPFAVLGAKPELLKIFHCPPASESCYEVEID